uniref:Spondin-like TSP1 domain-containing protein n=1 Tax=Eutreptiella gymnastica TaxID=73025 RepID=A0A7S1NC01_9EUGL|mmetsp:Transcript_151682/g.265036  ORF Transcript_151682/g.265036 Transcript_151682/m.265036 type:complete len:950 (+) Transcript_151682:120-2969(+)
MGIPTRVIPLVAAALALLITVLYVSISSDIGQEQWVEPTNAGVGEVITLQKNPPHVSFEGLTNEQKEKKKRPGKLEADEVARLQIEVDRVKSQLHALQNKPKDESIDAPLPSSMAEEMKKKDSDDSLRAEPKASSPSPLDGPNGSAVPEVAEKQPVDCVMAEWGEWSVCSATCGGGSQLRTRYHTTASAHGGAPCGEREETRTCETDPCPVDCVLGTWTEWSACSASCGGGSQVRTRPVDTVALHGGAPCEATEDTRDCATEACAETVDCLTTEWTAWSECSVSCGGGRQLRTRSVETQPTEGGAPCPPTEETQDCGTKACAAKVHCQLTEWTAWSACSVSCGGGRQLRTRSIEVQPAAGAAPCGPTEEIRDCLWEACEVEPPPKAPGKPRKPSKGNTAADPGVPDRESKEAAAKLRGGKAEARAEAEPREKKSKPPNLKNTLKVDKEHILPKGDGLTHLQRLGIQPILASIMGWPHSNSFKLTDQERRYVKTYPVKASKDESVAAGLQLFPDSLRQKWEGWIALPDKTPVDAQKPKWSALPPVSLWVRCHAPGAKKFLTLLLESMEWFWPAGYGKLVVVLDDESARDHTFGDFLHHVKPHPQIRYQPDPGDIFPSKICGRSKGYDRQMWSGFYADLYTDDDLIAIVDDDCLFVTPVAPEDLFEDGKPRVIGKQTVWMEDEGKYLVKGVDNGRWAYTTERMLRLKQAADFMWNFPILIKRSTFIGVRRWVAHVHNSTFDEAFTKLADTLQRGESYCQINVILNYAWYFQREEYKWHLQSVPGSPLQNGTFNTNHIRLATHARGLTQEKIYNYMIEGYCYACLYMENCKNTEVMGQNRNKKTLHQPVLHNWDHTGILWTEKSLGGYGSPQRAQNEHYEHVKSLPFAWPPSLDIIIERRMEYFADCSKPPDDKNCTSEHAHRHDMFQRVRASRSKHEKDFLEMCKKLIGHD